MSSSQLMQKSWWSAVAAAIKSFCALFIDLSDTLTEGVAMASTSVAAARRRQVVDIEVESDTYVQEALDRASAQRIQTTVEIKALLNEDADLISAFDTERARLEANVKAAIKRLDAEKAARAK